MPKPTSRRHFAAWGFGALLISGVAFGAFHALPAMAEDAVLAPPPAYNPPDLATSETAILSGGCFWGLQGVYEHVKGVTKVYAGYAGGDAATAQYETVSTGTTGHAESVAITFNPQVISYGQILQIYFSVATNPTELNYQGPDSGTQYRGEIWYKTPAQQHVALAYIAQLSAAHVYSQPIVTRVDAFKGFYNAEDYHQDYLVRNPDQPYIAINDIPKVEALQRLFPALYRADPVTVFGAG
ncbi:MAG: peptide-methionine (S)-S-oxide reductase [Acidocella sp. 20-57-95]|nr:MAG: peptide-methionine (S)-S-oxide reductase [Acidocella sp. 20-57-95]OYV62467.1 MAG: peptide-methionine (S)-S-oxide reductase [Acidocella sp. 21-58-7]HQT64102.1 peptide-methionine (S)-S-oxide reductase MsrA [Acidocella sp.]HQU03681.1 peptide-methionine (S)-S-oxide reductase MsrA [Acidocella sp.]